jgi:papain like cysteine protease AvrRpt2
MAPTTVAGTLTNADLADFSGYRINAAYTVNGLPTRTGAQSGSDGSYSLELPEPGSWEGPLSLTVTAVSGDVLGRVDGIPADGPLADIAIAVLEDVRATVVRTNPDPALGGLARFAGRVITTSGEPQAAGLLVVLWGVSPAAAEPHAVAVATTIAGGYFAGNWPSDVLSSAFARVGGGAPVPIPLDGDRLPHQIILVVDSIPDTAGGAGTVPRAPSAEDLAANPAAFTDGNCDCGCNSFTAPNRTVEEVTFQAVVRTTQPEIRGSARRTFPPVPAGVLNRFTSLVKVQPSTFALAAGDPVRGTTSDATVLESRAVGGLNERLARIADAVQPQEITSDGEPVLAAAHERAAALLAVRGGVELEGSVLADLSRERGEITPVRLLTAQQTSLVRDFRNVVHDLQLLPIARFDLDAEHQLNWDSIPYVDQATTVAHGHILTMKQVWRADGYSLGDLLYSMALAPGQQKLVSLLDWERREEDSRTESRFETEQLAADLSHDRDIADIIRSSLHEHMDGHSEASTSASGGAIGGFIGPVVFGAAGGVSNASSSANQASARDIAGSALNQARDRTLQSASSVRGQRSTVVQTARQGESVRAQTEAIANYNHCHALTIEYFEVLRHFQVSQEMAAVQECLFVPFEIAPFTAQKALRWEQVLKNLSVVYGSSTVALRPLFEAQARVSSNWADADLPVGRFADDAVSAVSGEFWMTLNIPQPADNDDDSYNAGNWAPYQSLLTAPATVKDVYDRYLHIAMPEQRAAIFNDRVAPPLARKLIDNLTIDISPDEGASWISLSLDSTLVTPFGQGKPLLVSFRSSGPITGITRAQITRVQIRIGAGVTVPASIELIVSSGSMRYRTEHLSADLFDDYRILNDLAGGDRAEIATPLTKFEKSNPREADRKDARKLLDVLNERVEFFHRVLWLTMDANRRYMFLDGVLAPDAGGRSVASVVENQVIGVVGNCLVMPVVPGLQLDPTYEFARRTPEDLRHLYATDPPPPMRISVPTKGVFAEAAMGQCNSCEKIDDTRFWHWDEAPIPDSPTAIMPLSTASRRLAPPSVTPSDFPGALVRYQQVPDAPDPTGLVAALNTLGSKDIFRDLTGLAMNQANAAAALKGVMTAAQSFASQGAALAQQKFLASSMDRNLDLVKKARDSKQIDDAQAQKLTESMFRGALGERRPESAPVTDSPAVKRAVDRVTSSDNGQLRITRAGGTVEVKTGTKASGAGLNAVASPPVNPIKQKSSMSCWAAAGTMMSNWKNKVSQAPEALLDSLGGSWRAIYDADTGLTTSQLRGFTAALALQEEGPASYTPSGLAQLVTNHGPLWVISDDSIDGNKVVHARIVTAVTGDGTVDGTVVTLVDPIPGISVTEPFATFAARLEAPDVVRFGVGIYHW